MINHDCSEKFWIRPKISTTTTKYELLFTPTGISYLPRTVPVEIVFPAKIFNENGDNSRAVYDGRSENGFESLMTDFYDHSLPIDWEFAKDNNGVAGEYTSFKVSTHTMYVTHNYPLKLNEVFETTIHIGCSEAAGFSEENIILSESWSPFDEDNFNPARVGDGAIFTYWNSCDSYRCNSLSDFLKMDTPDARCNEFTDLFKAVIENQGIEGMAEVLFNPTSYLDNMFMNDLEAEFGPSAFNNIVLFQNGLARFGVKRWTTYIQSASNNIFLLDMIPTGCSPVWAQGDAGIQGQGMVQDPVSLHANHVALTYKNSEIFDPSYGYRKNWSRALYEDDNLDIVGGLIFSHNNNFYYWIGSLNELGIPETAN